MEGRLNVNDFQRFIRSLSEALREQAETNKDVSYDLGFRLTLASPKIGVTSSEALSNLDKLSDALGKFAKEDEFDFILNVPVNSSLSKYLVEKTQEKYEAASKIAAGPALVTAK